MRAVFDDLAGAVALPGTCKGVRDDEMAGLDREGAYWLEYQPAGYEWSGRGWLGLWSSFSLALLDTLILPLLPLLLVCLCFTHLQ